jgi:hypothetical protein
VIRTVGSNSSRHANPPEFDDLNRKSESFDPKTEHSEIHFRGLTSQGSVARAHGAH